MNQVNFSFLVILLIVLVVAFSLAFRFENRDTIFTDVQGVSERG